MGVHRSTVSRWLAGTQAPTGPTQTADSSQRKELKDSIENGVRTIESNDVATLEDLLAEAKVDLDEWLVVKYNVGYHVVTIKAKQADGTHKLIKSRNPKINAVLERRPSFFAPVVRPVTPLKRRAVPTTPDGVALILPDSQHGFRRKPGGELDPLHDVRACDVALQTAELLQPDEIVLLGDMLDLAPWSSYAQEPELKYTTQPAIEALAAWLGGLRKACPSAKITYLEGNHEHRIIKKLNDVHDEASTLRGPDSDLPLLSIPYLLSLSSLDIDYVGPYGASYWLWGVRIHHGNVVRARGGDTAGAMLARATHSQIVGHIHRREVASRRIRTEHGPQTVTALSPGCLCRVDGAVPHKQGAEVDWQQGMALVYRHETRAQSVQLVPINDGVAYVHGHKIESKND